MSRMAVSENYFLLGKTAEDVKQGLLLQGNLVEAGLENRYLNPENRDTIVMFFPEAKIGDGFIQVDIEGVPVEIKIIKGEYGFLKHPETVIYGPEEYQLPNPMADYLKERDNIA